MNSRIGLLGGTFDPIHNGHLSIAKAAIKQLKLDNLLLIPAGNPWQKEEITEIQHRIAMTKLAIIGFSNIEVSEIEANRSGPTYTYQTLEELHAKYEETDFFLILGSDAARALDTWKEPNKVKTLARIYVVPRAGDFTLDWHFDRINMPSIEISSTDIREKIQSKQSIKDLVPENVEQYIHTHGLYQN